MDRKELGLIIKEGEGLTIEFRGGFILPTTRRYWQGNCRENYQENYKGNY